MFDLKTNSQTDIKKTQIGYNSMVFFAQFCS